MKRTKKGFTIVELVIVIGVIGILSAILIPTFVSLTTTAQTRALELNLRNAYSEYSAVAVDGVIDEEELKELAPEASYSADIKIEYLAQDKVQLDKGTNEHYIWSDTKAKWVKGTLELGTGTLTAVCENASLSVYNKFTVKYVKAA